MDADGDGIPHDVEAASPGQVVTYTVTVANTGTTASGSVTVTDALAPGLVLVDRVRSPARAQDVDGTITWLLSPLDAGTSQVLGFSAMLPATYPQAHNEIANTAMAEDAVTPGQLTSTATVTVDAQLGLSIDKRASATAVSVGTSVTYSYVVTNTGEAPLKNVTVTDNRLGIIGSVATLDIGASSTFTTATVLSSVGSVTNIATATGSDVNDVAAPPATDQWTVHRQRWRRRRWRRWRRHTRHDRRRR